MALLDDFFASSSPTSGGGLSLNSLLGTNVPEFLKRNLTDEELAQLQSKSNFQTALGLGKGYASQLYQNKPMWQKVVGAYSGAAEGRQAPYTTAQEGIFKALTGKKLMGDVEKQGYENFMLGSEAKSMKELIAQEPDPIKQREMAGNFKEYMKRKYGSDPSLRQIPEYDKQTMDFYGAIGFDPTKASQDELAKANQLLLKFNGAPSATDAMKEITSRSDYNTKFPNKPLPAITTKEDVFKEGLKTFNQPVNAPMSTANAVSQYTNPPANINVPSTDIIPSGQEQNIYQQPPATQYPQVNQPVQKPITDARILKPRPETSVTQTVAPSQTKSTPVPTAFINNNTKSEVERQKVRDIQPLAQKTINDAISQMNTFEKNAISILNRPDLNNAFGAFGSQRAGIQGTTAFEINNLLEQTRNAAWLQNFKSLKSLSPTGSAGTGGVSNTEGENIIGASNKAIIGLDPKAGKAALINYIKTIQTAKQNLEKGYKYDYGNDFEFPKSDILPFTTTLPTPQGNVKAFSGLNPELKAQFPRYDLVPNAYYTIINGKLKLLEMK
jgi:hypothetical protein